MWLWIWVGSPGTGVVNNDASPLSNGTYCLSPVSIRGVSSSTLLNLPFPFPSCEYNCTWECDQQCFLGVRLHHPIHLQINLDPVTCGSTSHSTEVITKMLVKNRIQNPLQQTRTFYGENPFNVPFCLMTRDSHLCLWPFIFMLEKALRK